MPPNALRIAVVAHGLRAGGGISVGANIMRALIKVRPHHSYLLITPADSAYSNLRQTPRVAIERFTHRSYLHRAYFDRISLPRRIRSFKPDVLLCLGNIPVPGISAFQALLIQNALLVYPDVTINGLSARDKLSIVAQAYGVRRTLSEIDLVFCQTDVMRRRFRNTFGFTKDILILPNAVSKDVIEGARDARPHVLPTRPGMFQLFALSRYYPSKNLEAIVECFDRYRHELHDVCVILTIADDQHPNARTLLAEIRDRRLDTHIINIGPVPQSQLPDCYRQVDALLLPTLLESFSGTYLESMAFERPILTSDRDFAKETCGEAALYFDPKSPQAMRDAILMLKQDAALRSSLIESGRTRLTKLTGTWESAIDQAMSEIEARLNTQELE